MNFKTYLLCEMAGTYTDKETGIGNGIYIKMERVGGKHGSRIKVSNKRGMFERNNCFVLTIEKEPKLIVDHDVNIIYDTKEIIRIKSWITINLSVLQKMSQYLETTYNQPIETPKGRLMLDFHGLEKYLVPLSY